MCGLCVCVYIYDDLLDLYVGVIYQFSAERFKLWEGRDNRQHTDRWSVRITLCIGLHLLNYDESRRYGARYFSHRLSYLCVCLCPSMELHSPPSARRYISDLLSFAAFQITPSLHKVSPSCRDITQQPKQG